MIGQYYYRNKNGAGGIQKVTPGFEAFSKSFYRRGAISAGEFAPPALLYERTGDHYFVGREEIIDAGDDYYTLRHGFLFPRELFSENIFGAKLYRFFDLADFDCSLEGFEKEETPSSPKKIRIREGAGDHLRPGDVFRRGREHPRFIQLLIYGTMLALTDDFSLVFLLPKTKPTSFYDQAVLSVKSLFALLPWELREYLTFHTYVDNRDGLGRAKISVSPLSADRIPRGNKIFYFDFSRFQAGPDLVIMQKTRGTVAGPLINRIWAARDEKALSSLFYIFHHNRDLMPGDGVDRVAVDALCFYFLLTDVGGKYRSYLADDIEHVTKISAREIMLFLAGHISNKEFLDLREMLGLI